MRQLDVHTERLNYFHNISEKESGRDKNRIQKLTHWTMHTNSHPNGFPLSWSIPVKAYLSGRSAVTNLTWFVFSFFHKIFLEAKMRDAFHGLAMQCLRDFHSAKEKHYLAHLYLNQSHPSLVINRSSQASMTQMLYLMSPKRRCNCCFAEGCHKAFQ